jgi:4Fe-4S ferredoxin
MRDLLFHLLCNAKLMKINDFNPDTVDLAIWIVDKMAIINDEICVLCKACTKIGNV